VSTYPAGTTLRVRRDESGITYLVRGTYSYTGTDDGARGYLLWGSDGEGFQLPFKATEVLMEVAP